MPAPITITWIPTSGPGSSLPPYGMRVLFIAAVGTAMRIGSRQSTDENGDHYITDGNSTTFPGILYWAQLPTAPG